MKKTLYIIVVLALFLSSCCKEPYAVAALSLTYPNLDTPSTLQAYLTERNDLSVIQDTLIIANLSEVNNYTATIEFKENPPNYILFIDGTNYSDTLTNISYNRKSSRCKESIEDFQYHFNGDLTSNPRLTIE